MPWAEGKQIAIWAAEAGADALHVAAGHYRSLPSGAMQLPPMALPDGIWLDYAGGVKRAVTVPVIAVGRLGDAQVAAAAVAGGKADFVALGRTLVAEPRWVEKLRRGETQRSCLACNTCINEMRGGARIGCVVNGMAGRETAFAEAAPAKGARIAVIGAGPAGLTYAALVAEGNTGHGVRARARAPAAPSAIAGKAPLFQEVAANPRSLERYVAQLVAACVAKGRRVPLRHRRGARAGRCWRPFDRIVIATGARYRFGLGPVAAAAARARRRTLAGRQADLLDAAVSRLVLLSRAARQPARRYRARWRGRGRNGDRHRRRAPAPARARTAIASAFAAALLAESATPPPAPAPAPR